MPLPVPFPAHRCHCENPRRQDEDSPPSRPRVYWIGHNAQRHRLQATQSLESQLQLALCRQSDDLLETGNREDYKLAVVIVTCVRVFSRP